MRRYHPTRLILKTFTKFFDTDVSSYIYFTIIWILLLRNILCFYSNENHHSLGCHWEVIWNWETNISVQYFHLSVCTLNFPTTKYAEAVTWMKISSRGKRTVDWILPTPQGLIPCMHVYLWLHVYESIRKYPFLHRVITTKVRSLALSIIFQKLLNMNGQK